MKDIDFEIHVPSKEFGFITARIKGTVEEAVDLHDEIAHKVIDKSGYNVLEWAKIRNNYMMTGEIHPDLLEPMSKAQRYFINEAKNAFKAIKK